MEPFDHGGDRANGGKRGVRGGKGKIKAVLLLLFFFLLNVINFVDRQILAGFGPVIVRDLHLSDTQFGLLNGLVFVFFYAVMGLFMGAMADRVNRMRLIAFGLALWSLMTSASGMARTFVQLAGARMFIGVGESSLTPASVSVIADLFGPAKRGFATGIYFLGIPIGAGTSFVAAGVLGPKIGWRNTFLLLGVLGIILSGILLLIKDPERGGADVRSAGSPAGALAAGEDARPSFRQLCRDLFVALRNSPALICIIVGVTFIHVPLGNMAFEQLWLVRERSLDAAKAAQLFGGLFIVSGLLGNIIGGLGGDWLNQRMAGGRMLFLTIVLLVMSPLILSYRFVAPMSPLFFCGMFLLGAYYMVFYGPVFATINDLAPVRIRSTVAAFALLSFNVIGIGLGVALSGFFSDYLRDAGVASPLTWVLFVSGLIGSCSVFLFFLAFRLYSGDVARLERASVLQMAR